MSWAVQYRSRSPQIGGAGRCQNLRRPGDPMFHHAPRVLADGIVDPRRGNAVAVLQHGVDCHPIVFLRQVLTGNSDSQPAMNQLAISPVMVLAPGQYAARLTVDGLADQATA